MGKASSIAIITANGKANKRRNLGAMKGRITQYRGKLYWSENVGDPRWEQRSFANIKSFDLTNNTVKKHTTRGRYFALAFNDELSCYAASSISREGINTIHLLNADTDKEIKQLDVPVGNQVSELSWINTEGILAVLVINDNGMGIYSLNINNGEWGVIL